MPEGTVVIEKFESAVLKKNPLGDPATRLVPIYLPPTYDGRKAFPTIYMLAGFAGTGLNFLNVAFGAETLPQRLDRLIATKKMREAIVVMPDCMTRFGGSQYLDSPATGRYETHLIKELIPHIDKKYATKNTPAHRAVMGKSSGGYGALRLAMTHADMFGAVACHSGDMNFDLCYGHDIPTACRILERYDGSLKKFWNAYLAAPKKPKDAFALINLMGMAAAYSPNPKRAFPENIDLPFDTHTAEKIPSVWKRWLAHDPIRLMERKDAQAALKRLTLLFIDCGVKDEFGLHFGARIFTQKLKRLGIAHLHEEFSDGHFETSYRYDVSLPRISKAIA